MGRFAEEYLGVTSEFTPESYPEGYKENAIDGDGDGIVQEGTPFERPVTQVKDDKKIQSSFKKTSKRR